MVLVESPGRPARGKFFRQTTVDADGNTVGMGAPRCSSSETFRGFFGFLLKDSAPARGPGLNGELLGAYLGGSVGTIFRSTDWPHPASGWVQLLWFIGEGVLALCEEAGNGESIGIFSVESVVCCGAGVTRENIFYPTGYAQEEIFVVNKLLIAARDQGVVVSGE